jgi:hypothetical protein
MTPVKPAEAPRLHSAFLMWRQGLYAKIAVVISLLCVVLYAAQHPAGPPNGGTTLGYGFGTLAALLVLWLAWFGIRRRRYGGTGSLVGLLSAHVYFGMALVVVTALHAGFRFHYNVHTLAFVLLVLVVASGMFGTYAFWRFPEAMTSNRGGATLTTMTAELAVMDVNCRQLALAFPDNIVSMVDQVTAPPGPSAGILGGFLSGRRSRLIARRDLAVISQIPALLAEDRGASPTEVMPLVQALTQRFVLLQRMHRDQRFRALMLQWRAIHVPLTVALIVALSIHVIAVFFNW